MKKAILISCFNGWYKGRLEIIRKYLEKNEYSVSVLLSDFNHLTKTFVKERLEECQYIHVPAYSKNLSFMRIVSHVCFGYEVKNVIEDIKPDLIYLVLPPNNTAIHCLSYKRKNPKTRYIIDLIDLWPESMPIGKLKRFQLMGFWSKMRNDSIKCADFIFTECNLYREKIKKLINEQKITVLHLYKDQSRSANEIILNNLETKKIICNDINKKLIRLGYVGSINHLIDIEQICEIIIGLKKLGYQIELNVIGDGKNREKLIGETKKIGALVNYFGKIFDEIEKITILGMSDFGLNIMRNDVEVGLTIKSVDYLSMGIPIINNIKGDTWDMVKENHIGINYDGNTQTIIGAIKDISSYEYASNAYNSYLRHFTSKSFYDRVCNALSDMFI